MIADAEKNVTDTEAKIEEAKIKEQSMKDKALEYLDQDKVSVLEAELESVKRKVEMFKEEKELMTKLDKALKDKVANMRLFKQKTEAYLKKAAEVEKLKAEVLAAEKTENPPS